MPRTSAPTSPASPGFRARVSMSSCSITGASASPRASRASKVCFSTPWPRSTRRSASRASIRPSRRLRPEPWRQYRRFRPGPLAAPRRCARPDHRRRLFQLSPHRAGKAERVLADMAVSGSALVHHRQPVPPRRRNRRHLTDPGADHPRRRGSHCLSQSCPGSLRRGHAAEGRCGWFPAPVTSRRCRAWRRARALSPTSPTAPSPASPRMRQHRPAPPGGSHRGVHADGRFRPALSLLWSERAPLHDRKKGGRPEATRLDPKPPRDAIS